MAEDGKGDFCEIETIELVDLIHIWQDKQKEFKKEKIEIIDRADFYKKSALSIISYFSIISGFKVFFLNNYQQ